MALVGLFLLSGLFQAIVPESSASWNVRPPPGAGAETSAQAFIESTRGPAPATGTVEPASGPSPTGSTPDALLASGNLLNGTFAGGYHNAPSGLGPDAVAYDSGKDEVFVADSSDARVSVFDSGMQTLLATIPVGNDPSAIVYDPAGSEVFVANRGSNNVTVINDTTLDVVANLPVGAQSGTFASSPEALEYASKGDNVFVAEEGYYIYPCCTYNVTEISGLSNAIVRVVQVGGGPFAEAYNPSTNLLYVLNYEGYSISIVDAATGAVVGTFDLSGLPLDLAIDPTDTVLGVVTYNGYQATASEYSLPGDSLSLLQSTPLPGVPDWDGSMTYDATNQNFLILAGDSGFVGVNPLNGSLTTYPSTGQCVSSIAYFSSSAPLLASDECANRVFELDPTTVTKIAGANTGIQATAVSYDLGNGDLYVADGSGDTVTVEDATTLQFVQQIGVGGGPSSFAYDSVSGTTFVLCDDGDGNATVEAIADSSRVVTASIAMPQPYYIANQDTVAYDPSTNLVYVVGVVEQPDGYTDENLTVISPTTNSVVGNETVMVYSGGTLSFGLYDRASLVPLNGNTVAVSNPWQGRVYGMNVSNGSRLWTADVGGTPTYMLLDPVSQDLDVALDNSPTIAVLDPIDGSSVGSFTLQHDLYDFTIDSANGRIYASELATGSGYVESVVDPSGAAGSIVPISTPLAGITYLPGSGQVVVAAPQASSVYYIGAALLVGTPTVSPVPQVQDEAFTIGTVAIDGFPPYTYRYSGLPPGCISQNSTTFSCTPANSGNWTITLTVSDQAGETSVHTVAVHVARYPVSVSLGIAPDALTPKNGTSVDLTADLTANESIGIGPLMNYTWKLSPTKDASFNRSYGAAVSISFTSIANVTVSLTSDLNGTINITSVLFQVASGSSSNPVGPTHPTLSSTVGSSDSWLLYVLAAVAVVAVLGAVLYLRRRQGPGGTTSPEETAPADFAEPAEETPVDEAAPSG
jgi:YVTN family beta-propeller protein